MECFTILLTVVLHVVVTCVFGANDSYPVFLTNACQKSGQEITCDNNHVIKIDDLRCMPSNYTCPEREKISNLCDGLRTCARIGLKRQLSYYCKEYPDRDVVASFQCIPGPSHPKCRTNICSRDSKDIRCRRGKVIHILNAKCLHGRNFCSPAIYRTLYSTCEGQKTCSISLLRSKFPPSSCDHHFVQQQNVFVDYICVNETVIEENCTGHFKQLSNKFGILKNPGYPNNPTGNKNGCYWAIYPSVEEEVDIHVHISFSQESASDCDSRFLQVQITDCASRTLKTRRFCDFDKVNLVQHSCGTVYIIHYPYLPGDERGNRFLVSYHVKNPSVPTPAYAPFLHQCDKMTAPSQPKHRYYNSDGTHGLSTEQNLSADKYNHLRNASPEVVSLGPSSQDNYKSVNPWRLVTIFRVVVVNIFLGIVILALVMALIYVCYRYKTYGKSKRKTKSESNTTSLTDDRSGSQAHVHEPRNSDPKIFMHDLRPPSRNSGSSVQSKSKRQIYTDTYEPASNAHTAEDSGYLYNEVSSFRNTNDSPHGMYSSYGRDGSESSEHYKPMGPHLLGRNSIDYSANAQREIRESLKHYRIDDADYAVVVRPQQLRDDRTSNRNVNKGDNSRRDKRNTGKQSKIANCDHRRHVHAVPDDEYVTPTSPTTMQLIPQHNCLLHHNLPPPPPPPAKDYPYYDDHSHYYSPYTGSDPDYEDTF